MLIEVVLKNIEMTSKEPMFRIIFVVSSCLMLTLAFLNGGYANDDHFTVIEIIRRTGRLPLSTHCWQCYHPKLFHFSLAKIWDIFQIESTFWKFRSAQLFNALFGILTLYILLLYTKSLNFAKNIKVIAFALIALNPRFISIFGQATNDALVIFLGNLALFSILKLFKSPSLKFGLILTFAVVFGSMAKMNFGIFFIGSILGLIILAWLHKNYTLSLSKGYLGVASVIFVLSIVTFISFNGYLDNITKNEKPFTYNTPVDEKFPPLYKRPSVYFPGIQTIYSGYFKFHYFEMIKNPRLVPGENTEQLTSLPSQMYGRTHFLYFDNWPEGWQTKNQNILKVGSMTIAMGIVPTLLTFFGILTLVFYILKALINKNWDRLKTDDSWLILLFFFGCLGFSIAFSLFGKNYTFMKVIYILPGVLSVVMPLCIGVDKLLNLIKSKYFNYLFNAFIIILIVLYQIPVVDLLMKLAKEQFSTL